MLPKLKRVCNRCGGTGKMASGVTPCTQCGKEFREYTRQEVREMNVDLSTLPFVREYDMEIVNKYPKIKKLFDEVAVGYKPERPCYMIVDNHKDQLKLSNRLTTVAYGCGWGKACEPIDAYTLNLICKKDYEPGEDGITKRQLVDVGVLVIMLRVDSIFQTVDSLKYILRMRRMSNKTTFLIADRDFVADLKSPNLKENADIKQFKKSFVLQENWTDLDAQEGKICCYL